MYSDLEKIRCQTADNGTDEKIADKKTGNRKLRFVLRLVFLIFLVPALLILPYEIATMTAPLLVRAILYFASFIGSFTLLLSCLKSLAK